MEILLLHQRLSSYSKQDHLLALLARKPVRVASVAMANKMARVVWAIMARGETYQARHVPVLAG
jgi:transposase